MGHSPVSSQRRPSLSDARWWIQRRGSFLKYSTQQQLGDGFAKLRQMLESKPRAWPNSNCQTWFYVTADRKHTWEVLIFIHYGLCVCQVTCQAWEPSSGIIWLQSNKAFTPTLRWGIRKNEPSRGANTEQQPHDTAEWRRKYHPLLCSEWDSLWPVEWFILL